MQTRKTSALAYKKLVEEGTLAKANATVYKHLFLHGPTTQKKTERALGDKTYTMRPRFAQLDRMGLIQCVGTIKCDETHVENMLWDVTDRIDPLKFVKKKTKNELNSEFLAMLNNLDSKIFDIFAKPDLLKTIEFFKINFL